MAAGSEYGTVVFGLASAASWGVGDFSGGLASRRTPVVSVVLVSQAVGLIVAIVMALLRAEAAPTLSDVLWGAVGGILGQIGIIAFYRAMAIGQMGIAAPVAAVLSAILPVVFSAITQGLPNLLHVVGFMLALGAIFFISLPEKGAERPKGLWLAIIAGLGFGGFFILIAQVHQNAVFWPLVAARLASTSLLSIILLATRRFALPAANRMPLILFSGTMDMGGNAFFVLATQSGRLDVAGVLSSLYPATTVLLAFLLLKEKVTRLQGVGIVLALIAILLIAMK
jgi:drug/metabolite transporter (DMT)-like permease